MVEVPKLSEATKALTIPEVAFEEAVKDATAIEIPRGPASVIYELQAEAERGMALRLPRLSRSPIRPRSEEGGYQLRK